MRLVFTPSAWQDYLWFQEHDRKLLKRINALITEALRTPFEGTGKPEPLKSNLAGCWFAASTMSIGWFTRSARPT